MPKEQFLSKIFAGLRRQLHFIRWPAKDFNPKLIAAVGKKHPTDVADNAVSDNHHGFEIWNLFFHPIELLAQDCRRVCKRVTTRITVEPELVMLSDHRIA